MQLRHDRVAILRTVAGCAEVVRLLQVASRSAATKTYDAEYGAVGHKIAAIHVGIRRTVSVENSDVHGRRKICRDEKEGSCNGRIGWNRYVLYHDRIGIAVGIVGVAELWERCTIRLLPERRTAERNRQEKVRWLVRYEQAVIHGCIEGVSCDKRNRP